MLPPAKALLPAIDAILMMWPLLQADHPRRHGFAQQEHGFQVGVEHRVPHFFGGFLHRDEISDAGVVDEDLDGAEFLLGLADGGGNIARARHVGWHGYRLASVALKFAHNGLKPLFIARAQGHLRSHSRQAFGDGEPDATARAGDSVTFPSRAAAFG